MNMDWVTVLLAVSALVSFLAVVYGLWDAIDEFFAEKKND